MLLAAGSTVLVEAVEMVGVEVAEVVTLGGSLVSDATVRIVNRVARPSSPHPSVGWTLVALPCGLNHKSVLLNVNVTTAHSPSANNLDHTIWDFVRSSISVISA